jgi:hypothetical protein
LPGTSLFDYILSRIAANGAAKSAFFFRRSQVLRTW